MERLDKAIWRAVDAVILVAVLGMVCLITLQVGSRLLGSSVVWTEELSRLLFIWTIWMGLANGFRNGTHPSLTLLTRLAPSALRPALRILPVAATVVLFSVVTWYGWALLQQQIRFGELSPVLQVGMWLATLPLVLGSALAIAGALLEVLLPQVPAEQQIAPRAAEDPRASNQISEGA